MINKNINELYYKLISNSKIEKCIKLLNNEIIIQPYNRFIMTIMKTDYFDVYINNTFYYSVESEEILDFINDFFDGKYVFIEKKKKNGKVEITCENISKIKKLNHDQIRIYSSSRIENWGSLFSMF